MGLRALSFPADSEGRSCGPGLEPARIAVGGRLVHPMCTQHAVFYTGIGIATAAVVASYDQRSAYSRAETAGAPRPQLLSESRHVAEIPCGSGHFLTEYSAARVVVTLSDANTAM